MIIPYDKVECAVSDLLSQVYSALKKHADCTDCVDIELNIETELGCVVMKSSLYFDGGSKDEG